MNKIITLLSILYFGLNVSAQPGTLLSAKKIGSGNNYQFSDTLTERTAYGRGICSLGDLNKDGFTDMAVSAYDTDKGEGVIYVLFLDAKQEVISYVEIGRNKGGLVPNSALAFDNFGFSMDALGDFNHDGTVDLLVGNQNEVYLLFMNTNGTVKGHKRIASNFNGLTLSIDSRDFFGAAVANIGDINGDGITDIAVYNRDDRSFTTRLTFLYILFLKQDGSVMRYHRIDTRNNILKDTIYSISNGGSRFGASICRYYKNRIVVGASTDYVEGKFTGAIYILDLDTIGEVTKFKKISDQTSGFTDSLQQSCSFGSAIDNIGDLDGDSIDEIAVAANYYKDSIFSGAVFILSFDKNDSIKQLNRFSYKTGGIPYKLIDGAIFGTDIAFLGDINKDGKYDIAVSAWREPSPQPFANFTKGRIHVLYLDGISHNNNPGNISNTNTLNSLAIYPNPTNGLFQISVADGDELEGDLLIMDMTGKAVYTIKKHNSKIAVDIKNIFSGMYIINYQTNKGIYQGKLIKE